MLHRSLRRFADPLAPDPRPNLTPLVDVTFLLLVFFLGSSGLRTLEGKWSTHLPPPWGGCPPQYACELRAEIEVTVVRSGTRVEPRSTQPWNGQGRFEFGADRELQYTVGARSFATLAQVRSRLADRSQAHARGPVTIVAGSGTTYAEVAAVLDLLRELGFRDVELVGRSADG
jgi:biopolymer transport protein ExbD